MSRGHQRRLLTFLLLLGVLRCAAPADSPPLPASPISMESLDTSVAQEYARRRDSLRQLLSQGGSAPLELARAWGELGKWYHAFRYWEEARLCYQQALRLEPDSFPWHYYLAHVCRNQGDLEGARRYFEASLDRQPGDVPTLVWLADTEQLRGNPSRARELLEEALRLRPGTVRALVMLGRLHLRENRPEKALEAFQRALLYQPSLEEALYGLAMARRSRGERELAQKILDRLPQRQYQQAARLEDPLLRELNQLLTGSQSHTRRGLAALERGRLEEAIDSLRRALEANPERAGTHYNLALAYRRAGRLQEAVEELQKALRLGLPTGDGHLQLALILNQLGRPKEAQEVLQEGIQKYPREPALLVQLGLLHGQRRQWKQALEQFSRALQEDPALVPAQRGRCVSLLQLGRLQEAALAVEEGRTLFPEDPQLAILKARLLAASPRATPEEAQEALRLAREGFRNEPYLSQAETVAMAWARLGRFQEALAWQQAARTALASQGPHMDRPWVRVRLNSYRAGRPLDRPLEPQERLFEAIPVNPPWEGKLPRPAQDKPHPGTLRPGNPEPLPPSTLPLLDPSTGLG